MTTRTLNISITEDEEDVTTIEVKNAAEFSPIILARCAQKVIELLPPDVRTLMLQPPAPKPTEPRE